MKYSKQLFVLFLVLCVCALSIVALDWHNKKVVANNKYNQCELGDLVGDDVERIKVSKFYVDYHSEDFKEEQINNFAQRCLNEGVKTQYQMDCCVRQKMYPEK